MIILKVMANKQQLEERILNNFNEDMSEFHRNISSARVNDVNEKNIDYVLKAPVNLFNQANKYIREIQNKGLDPILERTIVKNTSSALYFEAKDMEKKNYRALSNVLYTLSRKIIESNGSDWNNEKKKLDEQYKLEKKLKKQSDLNMKQSFYRENHRPLDPFTIIGNEFNTILNLD